MAPGLAVTVYPEMALPEPTGAVQVKSTAVVSDETPVAVSYPTASVFTSVVALVVAEAEVWASLALATTVKV